MVRAPCCEKMGLKKGPWTPEEDQILVNYIKAYGHGNWRALPKQAGLLRCGKSCRLRWINYLRPDIKRGNFTGEEEDTIIKLHESFGNRWSAIAARLPGRTDNEIKNVWHTNLKKRLNQSDQHEVSNTAGNPTKALNLDVDAKKEQDRVNVRTGHLTEMQSQELRRPLSPSQTSWSNDDITSSNITKSSDDSNENENNSSTNANDSSSATTTHVESPWDFQQVDESFVKNFQDLDIDVYLQWGIPFSPLVAIEPIDGQITSEDTNDNLDFWLDLFTRARLPEM